MAAARSSRTRPCPSPAERPGQAAGCSDPGVDLRGGPGAAYDMPVSAAKRWTISVGWPRRGPGGARRSGARRGPPHLRADRPDEVSEEVVGESGDLGGAVSGDPAQDAVTHRGRAPVAGADEDEAHPRRGRGRGRAGHQPRAKAALASGIWPSRGSACRRGSKKAATEVRARPPGAGSVRGRHSSSLAVLSSGSPRPHTMPSCAAPVEDHSSPSAPMTHRSDRGQWRDAMAEHDRGRHPEGLGWLSALEASRIDDIRFTKRRTEYLHVARSAKLAATTALGLDRSRRPSPGSRLLNRMRRGAVRARRRRAGRHRHLAQRPGRRCRRPGEPARDPWRGHPRHRPGDRRAEDCQGSFATTSPSQNSGYVAARLESHGSDGWNAAANLLWSAKEAALKVLRVGLRADTRTVEVSIDHAVRPDGWGR